MAKRFISTDLFNDEWFMSLTKDGKLFFIYFITMCDHAGVLRLNQKLCSFQTGIKDLVTVIKELGNSLVRVKQDTYFMPRYIRFQYPGWPQSNVKQQQGAIKILTDFDIEINSLVRVTQGLNNPYDNDNDNVIVNNNVIKQENDISKKGGMGENKIPPDIKNVTEYCLLRNNGVDPEKWFDFYSSKGWMIGKNKMQDWKAAVRTWEKDAKQGGVKEDKTTRALRIQRDYENSLQ